MKGFVGYCDEPREPADLGPEVLAVAVTQVASTDDGVANVTVNISALSDGRAESNEEYEAWLEEQQWQLEMEMAVGEEQAASIAAPTPASSSSAPATAPEPGMTSGEAEKHGEVERVAQVQWPHYFDATDLRDLSQVGGASRLPCSASSRRCGTMRWRPWMSICSTVGLMRADEL